MIWIHQFYPVGLLPIVRWFIWGLYVWVSLKILLERLFMLASSIVILSHAKEYYVAYYGYSRNINLCLRVEVWVYIWLYMPVTYNPIHLIKRIRPFNPNPLILYWVRGSSNVWFKLCRVICIRLCISIFTISI
jgi:hypothetical protein